MIHSLINKVLSMTLRYKTTTFHKFLGTPGYACTLYVFIYVFFNEILRTSTTWILSLTLYAHCLIIFIYKKALYSRKYK